MFHKISKSFLGTLLQRSNNQTKQFLDSGEMWSSSVVQRELNSARPHPNNNAIKAENHENAKIDREAGWSCDSENWGALDCLSFGYVSL